MWYSPWIMTEGEINSAWSHTSNFIQDITKQLKKISDVDVKLNFSLIESINNKGQAWQKSYSGLIQQNRFFFLLMLAFGELHCNMRKSTPQNAGEITTIFLQLGITRGPTMWRYHNSNNSIFQRSERAYLWLQSSSTSGPLQLSTK